MRREIIRFFRNKLNVACVIVELIALLFLLIGSLGFPTCILLFFIMQGVACIMWGVRILKGNGDIAFTQQYYDELPYSVEQKKYMLRTDEKTMKNNKFTGWTVIIMGIILIFMWMFSI